jgi:hypothetical protein
MGVSFPSDQARSSARARRHRTEELVKRSGETNDQYSSSRGRLAKSEVTLMSVSCAIIQKTTLQIWGMRFPVCEKKRYCIVAFNSSLPRVAVLSEIAAGRI